MKEEPWTKYSANEILIVPDRRSPILRCTDSLRRALIFPHLTLQFTSQTSVPFLTHSHKGLPVSIFQGNYCKVLSHMKYLNTNYTSVWKKTGMRT